MNFRQRLLLTMAVMVTAAVAAVAWFTAVRARASFEAVDRQRTAAIVAQFRLQFAAQQQEVTEALARLAAQETVQHIAYDAAHGGDTSIYLREAERLAREQQLDYLDIVAADATIVSSAEWPAHFSYKLPQALNAHEVPALDQVELAEGNELGLVAAHRVDTADGQLSLWGGRRMDAASLRELSRATGAKVWMAVPKGSELAPVALMGDQPPAFDLLRPLLSTALSGQETSGTIRASADSFDRTTVQAIPLRSEQGSVSAVLLVGTSRRPLLLLEHQIKLVALATAGAGLLLSILLALWISGRFSRPVEELAAAAHEIAAGNWEVNVPQRSRDEFGQLAGAFNSMTAQLAAQRDHLVQAERVAAWRELARRLAHELKNPLFPLQITLENMVRARQLPPAEFDEIFDESTRTLGEELTHMKTIIGRFSDFSRMPRPQFQNVEVNSLVERVRNLHAAQFSQATPPVVLETRLDGNAGAIEADPELLFRVLGNLVLNAVDAMPAGGHITLVTRDAGEEAVLEVQDTGMGMTPEESARLFTPYYTTKQHGTGLGLAIAQSTVSDHHGTIAVASRPGEGSTFVIHLPRRQPVTSPGENPA